MQANLVFNPPLSPGGFANPKKTAQAIKLLEDLADYVLKYSDEVADGIRAGRILTSGKKHGDLLNHFQTMLNLADDLYKKGNTVYLNKSINTA